VFDRYIWYHADLLGKWREGKRNASGWESDLYRALLKRAGESPDCFVTRFLSTPAAPAAGILPDRISFFGIGTMPPLMTDCLKQIASFTDICLFYLNPCCEYWGGMRSDFKLRRDAREKGLPEPEIQEDNPLLANLGTWGRDFFENTIDLQNGFFGEESFCEVLDKESPTMLDHLQHNILHSINRSEELLSVSCGQDRSISVHNCHNMRREVEILHDQILKALEDFAPEGIRPDDIIVMAPDINSYAPYIDAVFSSGRLRNSYAVSDRSLVSVSSTADNLLRILDLSFQRGTAVQIMEIIDNPAVKEQFGFDDSSIEKFKQYIEDAHICWGENADTREEFADVGFNDFSWQEGLDRLLLGCVAVENADIVLETPRKPAAGAGMINEELGDFVYLVRTLFRWRREIRSPRTPEKWLLLLEEIISVLYGNAWTFREETACLRRFIANWGRDVRRSGFDGAIPVSVLKQELAGMNEAQDGRQGFLARGITFCSLVPMRSIPAKIIAVLGMAGESFPRKEPLCGLDVSTAVRGERSRLLEDRYLFLETILSARKRLMFFYPGQAGSGELSPAAPLEELLAYLRQEFGFKETRHLRHACSPAYFRKRQPEEDPSLFSYSSHARRVAEKLREGRKESDELTPPPELPLDESRIELDLESLSWDLANGVSAFMKQRAGISTAKVKAFFAEDEEPGSVLFSNEELLLLLAENRTREDIHEHFIRSCQLPPGELGNGAFDTEYEKYTNFLSSDLKEELQRSGKILLSREFLLDGGICVELRGYVRVSDLSGRQLSVVKAFNSRDKILFYLTHLLGAVCGLPGGSCAVYVENKVVKTLEWLPMEKEEAETHLKELLEKALETRRRPLPLFFHASYEYVSTRSIEKSLAKFVSGDMSSGYCRNFFNEKSFLDESFLNDFKRLADIVYAPWIKTPSSRKLPTAVPVWSSLQNKSDVSYQPFDSLAVPLDGVNLVEAAAGTGKTYNIQNIVVRLLLEKDLPIESILITTYTTAAADELKSRLRHVIRSTMEAVNTRDHSGQGGALVQRALEAGLSEQEILRKLKRANLDFDKAVIGTLHSFCSRLLKDHAFEGGEDLIWEHLAEPDELLREFAADTFRKYCYSGEDAAFYSSFLSLEKLRTWVKKKAAHPELLFLPEPAGRDLSLEKQELFASWEEFRQGDVEAFISQFAKLHSSTAASLVKNLKEYQSQPRPSEESIKYLMENAVSKVLIQKDKGAGVPYSTVCDNSPLSEAIDNIVAFGCDCGALLRNKAVDETIARYEAFKKEQKLLSYDDMLRRTRTALENEAFRDAVRSRLRAGIVDEFQDTDPVQWHICRTLFGESTLFLVGDPRQAIYGFRGGDITTYLAARESVPRERRYTLSVNYRSCEGLLKEINRWFGEHPCGFAVPEIVLPEVTAPADEAARTRPLLIDGKEDPRPLSVVFSSKLSPEEAAAEKIRALLTAKEDIRIPGSGKNEPHKISPGDIAVLVRKWESGDLVREELVKRNIPCVVQKTRNVFTSPMAEHLQRVLESILNVNRLSMVKAALLTPLCGVTPEELIRPENEAQILEKIRLFGELKSLWENNSFYVMFRKMLLFFDVEMRFAGKQNGLRYLSDLIQMGDILHQESSLRNLSPAAVIDCLVKFRAKGENAFPSEQELDSGAVIICTEHHSKGLQYPVVILPSLHGEPNKTNHICHRSPDNRLVYDTGDSSAGRFEDRQELLRLAYVAMTRAQHACMVIVPEISPKSLSALAWLWGNRVEGQPFALPEELVEELPEELPEYVQEKDESLLEELEFTSPLRSPRFITSYTGLKPSGHGSLPLPLPEDEKENDNDEDTREPENSNDDPLKRLRGKNFGLMLHSIMEHIDFKADEKAVSEAVRRWCWLSEPTPAELAYAEKLIFSVLSCRLLPDLYLRDIPREKRVAEMEFHFGFSGSFSKGKLRRLADEHLGVETGSHSDNAVHFDGGFVTGSIDMVFEHEGKYHIVDWKSNQLPAYTPEMLKSSMAESYYHLQYLIYQAALLRYLKQRGVISDFSRSVCEKYVGGVHYVYMRGVDPDDPSSGVYHIIPDYESIAGILEVLK
ncbi:MAG: exodeoxyribonuclease V subunit gamma, partial [Lentisphaeria bacterium]|nr:exodeoxyribonuclease V subunit gamma [Lentisphaeria bacterium]